jgi:hypothetical protein
MRPLIAMTLLLSAGCVDETGYMDPPVGELDPSGLAYSAQDDLTEEQAVAILGLPGFLPTDSGTLTLKDADGKTQSAQTTGSTFAMEAAGSSGAEFTISFVPDEEDEFSEYVLGLSLDDDLTGRSRPTPLDGFAGPGVSTPDTDGYTHIEFGQFADPAEEYIGFNSNNGAVEIFPSDEAGLLLAETGDEVCIFETDADLFGPYWCTTVP